MIKIQRRFALLVSLVFLLFGTIVSSAIAVPTATIPTDVAVAEGKVVVPINFTREAADLINAFVFRLSYDETILTNPTLIYTDTLLGDATGITTAVPPSDGIGDLSIIANGVLGKLVNPTEGILLKVQFDVATCSDSQSITFESQNDKTVFTDSSYTMLNATFTNGSVLCGGGGDTTPPVITLTGDAEVKVCLNTAYEDAGATANDNVDGDITANIVKTGLPIDTAVAGTYTVKYNVSDAAGNAATEVTRTVVVEACEDTTPPVITLTGDAEVKVCLNTAYEDAGATANDNVDGDITANIVKTGLPIDTAAAGTYTVKYNVSDAAGNAATEVTRTVVVEACEDTTPPVITLNGGATVNVCLNAAYEDAGATANDNVDGDITANIVKTGLPIDTAAAGTYTVKYNVSDAAGNAATEVTRTVVVEACEDTTPPVITLNGGATVNVCLNAAYEDAGATATDDVDGDITADIVKTGLPIDTTTAGTYTVKYNVSDAAGNAAEEVTRTVIVSENCTTLGDADGNGTVSIYDALRVAQVAAELTTDYVAANADVDCSGAVNIYDALLIAQVDAQMKKDDGTPYEFCTAQ
ncbi:immunoglobulin-like fold-containing and DUF5011 [Desulfonema limicola]|uniref:Immunoglobulin-like fold-containing and DUF5011 n=1 Tax=Desulfonema limicola TaxID=45656 RepID=A0A975B4D6_9BACT|nr:immunoglobulin-like domain-containing protein [Desulfonema limicola]QTA78556.1 immunoglobulin-like fold-containing and DUF5011 [Desulfonema limicola]